MHEQTFAEAFSIDFTKTVYPEFWNDMKRELQTASKKELGEAAFYAGATQMLFFIKDMLQEMQAYEQADEEAYYGSEY